MYKYAFVYCTLILIDTPLLFSLLPLSLITASSLPPLTPSSTITYTATTADDLQPPMNADADESEWLGADTAFSLPIHLSHSSESLLWLFSDTLFGTLNEDGTRNTQSMPRNSIALFQTDGQGTPTEPTLQHYTPSVAGGDAHTGFFSPNNQSNCQQ